MPNTFIKIASTTVGSGGTGSVTFSGIPQTGYTDLVIKASARCTQPYGDMLIRFNSDSGANYSMRQFRGDGSNTTSTSSSAQTSGNAGLGVSRSTYTANTFGNSEIYIPNAFSSSAKSYSVDSLNENNATQADIMLVAGLWSGTAAISSITLSTDVGYGDFTQYSTFYLYGIKNS
jgi:hypothetical protein